MKRAADVPVIGSNAVPGTSGWCALGTESF